jgi:outer membrane lipoprotein
MPYSRNIYTLCLLATVLAACASGPQFSTLGVDLGMNPRRAAAGAVSLRGQSVLWGGLVVASRNRALATEVEVLAYPLDGSQRPDLEARALGRFIAAREGFVETLDFAPRRLVTVKGYLSGTRPGRIGEYPYTYPVLQVEDLYLWPKEDGLAAPARLHFGIGVVLGN